MGKPRFTVKDAQAMSVLYLEKRMSTQEIADLYQTSNVTVNRLLRSVSTPLRNHSDAWYAKQSHPDWWEARRAAYTDLSDDHRHKIARGHRRHWDWLKKYSLTDDHSKLGGHGVKMRETAWRLLHEMAAKRNLPIGEYIARLVEADARDLQRGDETP